MKIFRITDIVMAASWLLAFILSLPLIEPQALSRLGAVVCMAVFAAAGLGRELAGPGLQAPRTPLFWVLPLLWLLALASVVWSVAPMETFIAFATLGLAVLGFVLFASGRGVFRMLIPLAPALYVVLALLAVWAVVQRFFLPDMLVNHGVRHPFANPNNYASLLMLGFFPLLGLLLSAAKPRVIQACIVLSSILLAGIVSIGGLTVMALTAAGFAFMVFVCRGRTAAQRKNLLVIALAGLLVWGLTYVMPADPSAQGRDAPARLESFALHKDQSWEARRAIWRSTMEIIRDNGLMGSGYGTYYLFYPQYRLPADQSSSGMMAHNDLLQSWAEMGFIAPLLLLVLYIGAVCRHMHLLSRVPVHSGERALCSGLFTAAGLVAINAMVNFDLYTAPILCLLGLVLGLWLRYTALALGEPAVALKLPASVPPIGGWAVAILPLALLAFGAQGFLRSEYHTVRAQQEAMAGDLRAFDHHANMAISTSFGQNAQPFVMGAGIPAGILQNTKGLSPDVRMELIRNADALLDQAEARNPRVVGIYYNRALVALYGRGDKDAAQNLLRHALTLSPGHMPSRMMLASMLDENGNEDEAMSLLAEGLDRPPIAQNPESFYLMTAGMAMKQKKPDIREKAMALLGAWKSRFQAE